MLGSASRGTFVFFDPEKRLHKAQYTHGKETNFENGEWEYYIKNIKELVKLANIAIYRKNGSEYINVDGKMIEMSQQNFIKIVPKGGLKGYESH
jgi:site-specific DNA-adenine methylase